MKIETTYDEFHFNAMEDKEAIVAIKNYHMFGEPTFASLVLSTDDLKKLRDEINTTLGE